MNLTGPEKAAYFVLSLDEEQAAPLLSRMQDDDLLRLHQTARQLQRLRVEPEVLRAIYTEFVKSVSGELPVLRGGGAYLGQLYRRAIGEERATLLLDSKGPPPPGGPLDDVARDGRVLAEMLSHEHPQAIAAVLSQVDTGVAAVVLTAMSEELQDQVIDRMVSLESISPVALRATRDTLSTELGERQPEAASGVTQVAAILNSLMPEQSAMILSKIEARSPERAALIRREQFTFEDLGKLDRRGMQVLLREIDASQLVVSLKTASEEVRGRVFSSMSSRAAETIKEDLLNLGPQRLADVEKAQRDIVETAIRLQTEGKLVLVTGGQVV